MNFLYVCLFSNGHLKVGRSVRAGRKGAGMTDFIPVRTQ